MREAHRPKIGLALSGAAAKSVFYIGFLEVFEEQNVKMDYIAACSSASIVAASYACGTLGELKKQALNLNREFLFSMLGKRKAKSGIYSLDLVEEMLQQFTKNMRFEDVHPLMGFIAVDVEKGEQVVLSMGDIAKAARISCTLPGIFEPVKWGNKTLIDGGLLSVIPGDVVREAGMDIVIGVNMRGTKHIFNRNQMLVRRVYNLFKKIFLINHAENLLGKLSDALDKSDFFNYYPNLDTLHEDALTPGMFTVLGRSLDLAILAEKKELSGDLYNCDLLIRPNFEKSDLTDFSQSQHLYKLGRHTAEEYIPKIKQLLESYEEGSRFNGTDEIKVQA